MKRFLFFLLFSSLVYSQNVDYKYIGEPYYPEQFLSQEDSLKWPIVFDISIDVKDIKGLDEKRDDFFSKLVVSSFSKYEKEFITKTGEPINLVPQEFFGLYTKEKNLTTNAEYYFKEDYDYLFYDDFNLKSVTLVEAPFDHNWNLSNFPFDTQELKFKFITKVDTSIIKLRPSQKFKSKFTKSMENLKEGFNIESIDYKYSYNVDENDLIKISPDITRGIVTETLEIILKLNRQGSWMFLKLFLGGIVSFFISCIIFLIPKYTNLESKSTLGVGAIFGGIGNRYFVDASLEGVQVFTKADAVSNLIIFMIVFNIFIMILQNSKHDILPFFQSRWNSLVYSVYIFIVLLLVILLW
ncbi:hypothetical protein OAH77_03320 [Flavobacteriaceae bacterium]|nr:hypothetical protein [Flavobacteriaceae bacterium]